MKSSVHFLLLASIISLYYGISGLTREFGRYSEYTLEAEGTIIGIHEKAPSKGAAVHPIITFRDITGNEITFISGAGSPYYLKQVGRTIMIQYPEGFPDKAWIKDSSSGGLSPSMLLLTGTVLFIIWYGITYKSSPQGDGFPNKKP